MEVRSDRVILLTREGIFLELPRSELPAAAVVGGTIPVDLGEEWFDPGNQQPAPARAGDPRGGEGRAGRPRLASAGRRALAAAAAVVILLGTGLGLYQQSFKPAYEVAVEINPSVILEVNGFDRVVRARAVNADGEILLQQLQLRGLPVAEAVTLIVGAAGELGFLPAAAAPSTPADAEVLSLSLDGDPASLDGDPARPAATVAISIISPSETTPADARTRVVEALENTLQAAAGETGAAFDAVVQVITADELARARQAIGRETSIAKAGLAEKARARGVDLSDAELAQASVPDLLRLIGKDDGSAEKTGGRPRLNHFRVQPRAGGDDPDDDDRRAGRSGVRGRDGGPGDRRGGEPPAWSRGLGPFSREDDRGPAGGGPGRGRDGRDRELHERRADERPGADDDRRPGRGRGRDHRGNGRDDDDAEHRGRGQPGRGRGGKGDSGGPPFFDRPRQRR